MKKNIGHTPMTGFQGWLCVSTHTIYRYLTVAGCACRYPLQPPNQTPYLLYRFIFKHLNQIKITHPRQTTSRASGHPKPSRVENPSQISTDVQKSPGRKIWARFSKNTRTSGRPHLKNRRAEKLSQITLFTYYFYWNNCVWVPQPERLLLQPYIANIGVTLH